MKNSFISAYIYSYGATKNEAVKIYQTCLKNGNIGFIQAIIDEYNNQVKKSFYED